MIWDSCRGNSCLIPPTHPMAPPAPPPPDAPVQLSSVEINILIYLYLQESNFPHTAFALLAESNLPATPLFQHFNPAYPSPGTSPAAAAKAARARQRRDDPPAFGSAAGRIPRGELVRKLWKAVRWEQVERHVGENGVSDDRPGCRLVLIRCMQEPLSPECPNPFHLLIPHVCPPSYPSARANPPLPLPSVLQAAAAHGAHAGDPPPKRPEAFPPPDEGAKDKSKGKRKSKRPSSSPAPADRSPSPPPPPSTRKPTATGTAHAEARKEKERRKRARMSDAEDDDKASKKKDREQTLQVPSTQPSRATSPDKSRRPNPRSKEKDKDVDSKHAETADEIGVWTEHRDVVSNVAWNPKNVDLLATGSSDGFVRLWDFLPPATAPTAACPSLTLPSRPTGISHKGIESSKKTITSVAWHPDGTILATGSQDGVGRLFTPSGQLQAIMSYGRGAVNAMKWSPSGTQILVGKDDFTVCKWMDRGGSMAMKMCYDAHTKEVNDVDWLDDQVFASAGNDHAIHVHHGDDKRPRFTFRGHTDDVTRIKWSPLAAGGGPAAAERLLASVSDDGNCMIWKLPFYPASKSASVGASAGAGAGAGAGTRSLSPMKKMEPPSDEDDYFHQQQQQPSLSNPNPASDSGTGSSTQTQTLPNPRSSSTAATSIENCLHRLNVVSGSENKRMSMLEWMPVDDRDQAGQGRMILAACVLSPFF